MNNAFPAQPWANRIVGEAEVAPDQLLASPWNWRIHSYEQKTVLRNVLESIGWCQRIIVSARTQQVIDGHARVAVALEHNEPVVPVVYVDVTEDEERMLLATLDPLAGEAGMDVGLYAALVQDVLPTTTNTTLANFLASMVEDVTPEDTQEPREAHEPQEVCCPSCGTCFTPERQGRG